jgi:purine-nucleoside phosphorylase
MSATNRKLAAATEYLKRRLTSRPQIAVVLGSGLGAFADILESQLVIPAAEIPDYPVSTVSGHAGKWIVGKIGDRDILVLQGRVHGYEGYALAEVVLPIHLIANLGVRVLVLTNAAGGLNRRFHPGDLMLITDQINLMLANPLVGQHDDSLGPRFPDMSQPYSSDLQEVARNVAQDLGIVLRRGVLGALRGPTYETAAEVRMMQCIGVDASTMSTVPEVITAVYRGLRVLGISCITNVATGMSEHKLSHDEVTRVADQVRRKFTRLLVEILHRVTV